MWRGGQPQLHIRGRGCISVTRGSLGLLLSDIRDQPSLSQVHRLFEFHLREHSTVFVTHQILLMLKVMTSLDHNPCRKEVCIGKYCLDKEYIATLGRQNTVTIIH